MKSYFKFSFIILFLFFSSCDNDGDNEYIFDNKGEVYDLSIIANSVPSSSLGLLQIDVNSSSNQIIFEDLNTLFDMPNSGIEKNVLNNLVSFHSDYSVWQKDVSTNEVFVQENYYIPSTDSNQDEWTEPRFITNSNKKLVTGFDVYYDSFSFFINIHNPLQNSNTLIDIGVEALGSYDSNIIDNEFLVFAHTLNGLYVLSIIDLENEVRIGDLFFDQIEYKLATLNDNKLYVFLSNNRYKIFDINSLDLIGEGNANIPFHHYQDLLFKTTFFNNKMVFQSETIGFTGLKFEPSIFDFGTESYSTIYLSDTRESLMSILSVEDVALGEYKVDFENERVFMRANIYDDINFNFSSAGILIVDFNSEIKDFIDFNEVVYIRDIILK